MKSFFFPYRFLLTLVSSFVFLSAHISAQNQTYYKWYDENGQLHFSDTPPLNTQTEVERRQLKNQQLHMPFFDPSMQETPPILTLDKPARIGAKTIRLVSPKNDTIFHTNNGTIELKFETDKPLSSKQYIRVILDSKVRLKTRNSPLAIKGLNRGEHELKIDLIENKTIIASSKKVRFFIHSASVIKQKGQAVMAPKAPTLTHLPKNTD